ncbi:AAA family ATPase [Mycoplasmopsis cynos]|uniref:AAA family ATPase n=1 Tax=Mycoplasmopsis cynos TaxID=171284 RepID=UPI0024CBA941|nr:AAA family ATPase [Mycoplasmopsis cynos]WAM10667.1 AAA family ATPase [Mycoplasmopsis cynos]
MIDQLNLLIYHIEKNFEIYKILWFKSFKEAFENKESSDFFDEFKKFNKREGGLFTKYIDISKTISEVLDAYREYHPNYEENSTFKLNCLIEKELCEGTIENCECKKTSDFAKLLEYIQNIFKLSKKYGKKLIFNYFSHNVDLKENKFNVLYNNDINHKNYYDELKNEIINDKNISKIELDELRYCFLYSDFNANKNYYKIKFPDRTMLKSFLFIGLDFSLIEKVTIDVILKSFFTNLEITNKNLTTDKNNYIKYIKSELNNIVFPFEKDLKTNDYQTLIQNIKSLNGFLKSEIIGENKQIDLITKPIPNRYVLNQEIKKPWRSYLFAGPTGVGKTKTAELIAEKLFSKDKFLILNMSEYADEIKSLIDQNGALSKQLSNNPQSIVLFDEIEKASQKTIDILLQILSTGTYVDNMGSEISLKNSIVICTTNLNSTLFEYKRLINKPNEWLKSAKLKFREEILGRFDDIILFNEISNDVVYEIFCKKLNDQLSKISASYKNEIDFIFDHKSFKRVVKKIIESGFGVRKIESFIDINILSTISNVLLEMDLNKKIIITLKYEKNKVIAKGEYNEK